MAEYTVGAELYFPDTGKRYVIIEVDHAAGTVTFAPHFDLGDPATETVDDLEAVDAQVDAQVRA